MLIKNPLLFLLPFMALTSVCPAANEADLSASCQKINAFGLTLLQRMLLNNESNIAISPIGIYSALATMQSGAGGETLKEMNHVFGETVIANYFSTKYDNIASGTSLKTAMLVDKRVPPFSEEYKKGVSFCMVRSVDFANDRVDAIRKINSWVNSNTKGMIKNMLPQSALQGDIAIVTMNAFALGKTWKNPFSSKFTRMEKFKGTKREAQVSMMHGVRYFFCEFADDYTLVAVPFSKSPNLKEDTSLESDLYFVMIMPPETSSLQNLAKGLTWDELGKSLPSPESRENWQSINLGMPKFTVSTPTFLMNDYLMQVGLKTAFDPAKANFEKLSSAPICLGQVFHQGYIKVDEKGAQIITATVDAEPFGSPPPPPPVIIFNRAFLWLVYDAQNKSMLFCGALKNPS